MTTFNDKVVIRVTDSLSKNFDKLYKTGGFALAFGFAGMVAMIIANIHGLVLSDKPETILNIIYPYQDRFSNTQI